MQTKNLLPRNSWYKNSLTWSVDSAWGETIILCRSLCISSVRTYLCDETHVLNHYKIHRLAKNLHISWKRWGLAGWSTSRQHRICTIWKLHENDIIQNWNIIIMIYIIVFERRQNANFAKNPFTRRQILEDVWHFLQRYSFTRSRIRHRPEFYQQFIFMHITVIFVDF